MPSMRYPQILILPVLMLADYFLTVAGAILKDRGYSKHFRSRHYELNPVWQKQIAARKWFSPRHLLTTVITCGALTLIFEFGNTPDGFAKGAMGCLFTVYGLLPDT